MPQRLSGLLSILFLSMFLTVSAQTVKTEVDLGTFYPHNLDIIADNDSSLCVYFKNPTTDKFKVVNNAGQLVRTATYSNKDYEHGEKLPLLGKVVTDSAFVFYFASKKGDLFLNMQSIGKSGNEDKRINNIRLKTEEGDLLLQTFQNNNQLCVFTCDKTKQKLKLFVLSGSASYKVYEYANAVDVINFYKSGKAVIVNESSTTNITSASKIQKIYNTDRSFLTLSWDKVQQPDSTVSTVLWQFNLNTGQLSHHKFSGTIANTNSFYFEGALYRLSLTPNQFRLQLFDINTEKLMHTYEYGEQEKISLVYDKVINDDVKDLTEPAQILRLLAQNFPAISVFRANGDTLCLLIGCYPNKEPKSDGIVIGTSTQTTTIVTPDGPALKIPSEFKLGDHHTYTRFSSFIRKSDFEIISNYTGVPDFSKYNMLIDSLKKLGAVYDFSVRFNIANTSWFGFLPKNTTRLKIIQLQ